MALNHATPVQAPPGIDCARSAGNFVLTASAPATFAQVGATGTPTSVSVTFTRDQARNLALFLLGATQ